MNCGECPVSLVCHSGNLAYMRLCPLCRMLNVYTLNREIYKIECNVRPCSIHIRKEWLSAYIAKSRLNYFDRKFSTTLSILDHGPPQKKYTTYGTRHISIVYVGICNECYSLLKNKGKIQCLEEVRHMLDITE